MYLSLPSHILFQVLILFRIFTNYRDFAVVYLNRLRDFRALPKSKMVVLTANTTGESLEMQDYYVTDASRGSGYYGTTSHILTPNGRLRLSNSIFTRLTLKELKPLEVHVKINGEKCLVLHHDLFEKNEAIIFVKDDEEKLAVNVVPRKTARRFADRIWGILPSCGPGSKYLSFNSCR